MATILIKNAQVVNRGKIFQSDILVKNGRIDKIDSIIDAVVDREIDATGKYILPGIIDDQVHFRGYYDRNKKTKW